VCAILSKSAFLCTPVNQVPMLVPSNELLIVIVSFKMIMCTISEFPNETLPVEILELLNELPVLIF
jgi:hypothetical protein